MVRVEGEAYSYKASEETDASTLLHSTGHLADALTSGYPTLNHIGNLINGHLSADCPDVAAKADSALSRTVALTNGHPSVNHPGNLPNGCSTIGPTSTSSSFNDHEDGVIPIAVIGMGCRFPGDASSPEKLWDMLASGRNGWSKIPAEILAKLVRTSELRREWDGKQRFLLRVQCGG